MLKNNKKISLMMAVLITGILMILTTAISFADTTLGTPNNVKWKSGSTATATWDSVDGANYYAVTVYVYYSGYPIKQAETGTSETSLDVQQEIQNIVDTAEYDATKVQVNFDVTAQKLENGTVVDNGEKSATSDHIDYTIGTGFTQKWPAPAKPTLSDNLGFTFTPVEGVNMVDYYRTEIKFVYENQEHIETGPHGAGYVATQNGITGSIKDEVDRACRKEKLEGKNVTVSVRAKVLSDRSKGYITSDWSEYSDSVEYTVPNRIPYGTKTNVTLSENFLLSWEGEVSPAVYIKTVVEAKGFSKEYLGYSGASYSTDWSTAVKKYIQENDLSGKPVTIRVAVQGFNGLGNYDDGIHSKGEWSEFSKPLNTTIVTNKEKLGTPTNITWNPTTCTVSWDRVEGASEYYMDCIFKCADDPKIEKNVTFGLSATFQGYSHDVHYTTTESMFSADITERLKNQYKKLFSNHEVVTLSFRVKAYVNPNDSADYYEGDYSEYIEPTAFDYTGPIKIATPDKLAINPENYTTSWHDVPYAVNYVVDYKFIDEQGTEYTKEGSGMVYAGGQTYDFGTTWGTELSHEDGVYVCDTKNTIRTYYDSYNFGGKTVKLACRIRAYYAHSDYADEYIASDFSDWTEPVDFVPDVKKPVEGLSLSPDPLTVAVGKTLAIGKTITPDDAYYEKIDWRAGDSSIAAVDEHGIVTGVKGGQTTVTGSIGSVADTINVYSYDANSSETNPTTKKTLIEALIAAIDSITNHKNTAGTDIDDLSKVIQDIISGAKSGKPFYVDVNQKHGTGAHYADILQQIERRYGDRSFVTGYDVAVNCHYTDGNGTKHDLFNITELDHEIEFGIEGANLPTVQNGKSRIFEVYRMHDGKLEKISFTRGNDGGFKVTSNKFSDYVVVYYDKEPSSSGGSAVSGGGGGGAVVPQTTKGDVSDIKSSDKAASATDGTNNLTQGKDYLLKDGSVEFTLEYTNNFSGERTVNIVIGDKTYEVKATGTKPTTDDVEKAGAVINSIESLPAEITLDNEEAVTAARTAYDALTDIQKAQVSAEALGKLTSAETTIQNWKEYQNDVKTAKKLVTEKVKVKNIKGKKIKMAWSKANGDVISYQVKYSTNKKFKKSVKTKTISASKLKLTIKNLKKGKMYYVQIRPVVKVTNKAIGKVSNVYGKATLKKVKIKR